MTAACWASGSSISSINWRKSVDSALLNSFSNKFIKPRHWYNTSVQPYADPFTLSTESGISCLAHVPPLRTGEHVMACDPDRKLLAMFSSIHVHELSAPAYLPAIFETQAGAITEQKFS